MAPPVYITMPGDEDEPLPAAECVTLAEIERVADLVVVKLSFCESAGCDIDLTAPAELVI